MLSVKNLTAPIDFRKSEELRYQFSEAEFHLDQALHSLEDLNFHIEKFKYHASLFDKEFHA